MENFPFKIASKVDYKKTVYGLQFSIPSKLPMKNSLDIETPKIQMMYYESPLARILQS